MAAIWFAKLGVNARIIDKRDKKIFTGQADGLQPRALEVFNSFGFVDRPLKEASVGFGINHPCNIKPTLVKQDANETQSPAITSQTQMVYFTRSPGRWRASLASRASMAAWFIKAASRNGSQMPLMSSQTTHSKSNAP